jgi:superfamily II DNA or RNA helicase
VKTATFASEIEPCFSAELQSQGEALAEGGQLSRLIDTDNGFVGHFKGPDGAYSVEVAIQGVNAPGDCNCPTHARDGLCAHIWAGALLLDKVKKVDAVPARASLEDRSLKRLQALRGKVQRRSQTAWDMVERSAARLVFVVDQSQCEDLSQISLFVERQTVKVDGGWSTGKPFDLSCFDFEELPGEVDRDLLGLMGYGPDRFGSSTRDWRLNKEEHGLSAAQASAILPAIARAGRLEFLKQKGTGGSVTLDWDADGPFAIQLQGEVSKEGDAKLLLVSGSITRGDESHSYRSIQAILPGGLAVIGRRLVAMGPEKAVPILVDIVEGGAMAIGESAVDDFQRIVGSLPAGVWQPATEEGAVETPPPGPAEEPFIAELRVEVTRAKNPTAARLECEIVFEYGPEMRVTPDSRVMTLQGPEEGEVTRRDLDAEAGRLEEYLHVGGRRSRTHRELGQDGNISAAQFPRVARDLMGLGWRVKADKKVIRYAGEASVSVKSGIDWFDVKGRVAFGEESASLPELLKAARSGQTMIELGDGSTGMIPEDWLQTWGLLGVGHNSGDQIRFQNSQGWLLNSLLAERKLVEMDEGFEAYSSRLAKFASLKPRKEPAGFQGELRPYQRDALGWFRFLGDMGFGGCLADDMGLGKTVQVLALLESRRARKLAKGEERRPSIVVAPRSLVFNWIKEAARFAPKLKSLDYTGTGRKARLAAQPDVDLLVTTYGSLRRDAAELAERAFDYVVLDEATAIKNAGSLSAKAVRILRADHRLALTGTPVENNLHELWSLFEFLNPGMLGRSSSFKAFAEEGAEATDVSRIGDAIRPFFLRRTKTEVLTELPAKTEQVLTVELSKKNRERYNELREHFRAELLGAAEPTEAGDESELEVDKLNVLTALLRLRQAACHPGLVDEDLRVEESAKLEALMPRLQELCAEGHKVLVFSQFTTMLGIVKDRLTELSIPFEYLDGQTTKRQECVERFQSDPSIPVFLISLKAGGHGLNLTSSDYVFILDPWWNPAIESQAIDRAHRMGQTRPVFAYRLISKDTVEERVMEMQAKKRQLADDLFQGGTGVMKNLTRADLDALLS